MPALVVDPATELTQRRARSDSLTEGALFSTGYGRRYFIFLRRVGGRWVAVELTARNCALIAGCRSGKCSFTPLSFDDLQGLEILSSSAAGTQTAVPVDNDLKLQQAVAKLERDLVTQALARTKNDVPAAAKLLGISERALKIRIAGLVEGE